MKSVFRHHYDEVVRPSLMEKFGYKNIHAVPKLDKIVINIGLGKKMQDKNTFESAVEALSYITGQKPCITKAKKSIAGFKIREGMPLGLKVTLRNHRMYEFLQRLILVAMPRIRDFRGVSSKSFDGNGNFALGIKEYHIFPEIKYDKISDILGMDIVVATTARTDQECKSLLQELGIPFRN